MKHLLLVFFGNRVALLRKDKKMTQEALALASNLDRSYICGIESGRRNPTLTTMVKIANALGVELKEMFTSKT
ncbi:helix-turn-helix transcriptional regulator [Erwinia pyri]|uniref:Helix-turn-helix transcriptional regulator n=1 Tax=Erwinia pyri TaxID=3062598 RepID=A0AA50HNR1_9GAMM|nr:helix-turn-helix transcriptional regulator [Erwinia sp. DE2]WLS77225.1 helix-turn-helix transcriptional regulator [Erwinia sp. DE2]